jgi:hypothetical protein
MGNFEGSNRSSRSCISTEKDDADQPRRIDKHGPMLLTGVATMDTDVTRGLSALVVRSVPWSGAAALRHVWEQLGLPLTVGKERSAA